MLNRERSESLAENCCLSFTANSSTYPRFRNQLKFHSLRFTKTHKQGLLRKGTREHGSDKDTNSDKHRNHHNLFAKKNVLSSLQGPIKVVEFHCAKLLTLVFLVQNINGIPMRFDVVKILCSNCLPR